MGSQDASVDLYWLPLGAGDHCVRMSGRLFETLAANHQRRRRADLYHSALEVRLDGQRFVIEMAPVWGNDAPDRGVVRQGPVGLPWLGRSRWFRYEVRCWPNGIIPDASHAVDSPRRVSRSRTQAEQVLQLTPHFPTHTWGRDELGTGEMWNSNSLVAWLLARSGHEMDAMAMPVGGRAPGWSAGLVMARRQIGAALDFEADFRANHGVRQDGGP